MAQAAKAPRQNRPLTVDFHDHATYSQLLGDTKAFIEFVLAFILSLGFQLHHKLTCSGGRCLTRHSHYARVRLGGLTIWRIPCTSCKAVFTVLPHFVLRYRRMSPDVARQPQRRADRLRRRQDDHAARAVPDGILCQGVRRAHRRSAGRLERPQPLEHQRRPDAVADGRRQGLPSRSSCTSSCGPTRWRGER
jgi:hypothetical protein